jgi:hypothetical protein
MENFGKWDHVSIKFIGNLRMPEKESERFVSALGHLDTRVDLVKNIRPGDTKYFGLLSAMASKLSYENRAFIRKFAQDQWKVTLLWSLIIHKVIGLIVGKCKDNFIIHSLNTMTVGN